MTADTHSQVTPERPWLGLARFTEAERDYFYGRDTEIAELRDRVLRAPLTVLYGVSGYGKSSLLGAGLVPTLREEGLLPVALPRFVFDDPTRPVLAQAIEFICAALPPFEGAAVEESNSLWELFHHRALPWWQPTHPAHVQPVLIFDQFEDFFTQGEDKGGTCALAAREFLAALADLVENRPPAGLRERLKTDRTLVRIYDFQARRAKIVLALREDFLARLERWRRVMPSLVENRLELRLLTGPQALRAVLEPARKRSGHPPIVEPITGAAIVRFVAGVPGDVPLEEIDNVPPLLSLICTQLNERRFSELNAESPEREDLPLGWVHAPPSDGAVAPGSGKLHTAAEEVLERFYSGCFREHFESVRIFVEDELVSNTGFRETVTLDTAYATLLADGVPDPRAALSRLVDQRLLVIEDRGGISRVELTHDVLAGLALRSRTDREQKKELAQREQRIAAERRRARQRAVLMAVMFLLTAVAVIGSFIAARKSREAQASARHAKENLITSTRIADGVIANVKSKLSTSSGLQVAQREIIAEVFASYRSFREQAPDDPVVLASYARAGMEMAALSYELHPSPSGLDEVAAALDRVRQATLALPNDQPLQLYYLEASIVGFRHGRSENRHQWAQSLVTAGLPLIERIVSQPGAPASAHLILVRYYNAAGTFAPDSEKALLYEKAITAIDAAEKSISTDGDHFRLYIAPRVNLADLLRRQGDVAKARSIIEPALKAAEEATRKSPETPLIRQYAVFTFQTAAAIESDSGASAKAASWAEDAVASALALVQRNPDLPEYQKTLAEAQGGLAQRLNHASLPQHQQRRASFYAVQSAETWLRAARLQPHNAQTWSQCATAFARVTDILEKVESPDLERYYQLRLAVFDEGSPILRADIDSWLSLAKVFLDYAQRLTKQERYKAAFDIALRGATEFLRTADGVAPPLEESFQMRLGGILTAAINAATIADTQLEAVHVVEAALPKLLPVPNRMRAATCVEVMRGLGRCHLKLGHLDEGQKFLDAARQLLSEHLRAPPPHYYLKEQSVALNQAFAELHEKRNDPDAERAEWEQFFEFYAREYRITSPNLGKDGNAHATSLSELRQRARDVKPHRKMFVIPCRVGGELVPIQFFIKDYIKDETPLLDQVPALAEIGIVVPSNVIDSLKKLHEIALENKVGFVDLCTYALNYNEEGKPFPSGEELRRKLNLVRAADAKQQAPLSAELAESYAQVIRSLREEIRTTSGQLTQAPAESKEELQIKLFDSHVDLALYLRPLATADATAALGAAYSILVSMNLTNVSGKTVDRLRRRIQEAESQFLDDGLAGGDKAALDWGAISATVSSSETRALHKKLARAYGSLAWMELMAGEPENAKRRAEEALKADPSEMRIYSYLAHALMYLGKFDEAREIYLRHRDATTDGKPFHKVVMEDFKALRAAGREHPDMKRIEQAF